MRRDDLLILHVDGTKGSAVAGLRDCVIQHYGATPRPTGNPDIPKAYDYFEQWQPMPEGFPFYSGFKIQWEMFLKHIAFDTPYEFTLLEAAKGVQLAELDIAS